MYLRRPVLVEFSATPSTPFEEGAKAQYGEAIRAGCSKLQPEPAAGGGGEAGAGSGGRGGGLLARAKRWPPR